MSKIIRTYVEALTISKPIFHFVEGYGPNHMRCIVAEPVDHAPVEGDPLANIVRETFSERFDIRLRRFIRNDDAIVSGSLQKVKERLGLFVRANLPLKRPEQSLLYKWVRYGHPEKTQRSSSHGVSIFGTILLI
jgi:hypothetical protein